VSVPGTVARAALAFAVANAPRTRLAQRRLYARVLVTQRARIDVTLDAKPYRRIQRWHFFHVAPGATVLRLNVAGRLSAGGYRLFWKATAEGDRTVARRITPLQVLPRLASAHIAKTPQVVVVGGRRATTRAGHVERLSRDRAYVYATFHDVSVFVVDADTQGLQLVQSLRAVFPLSAVVAVSRNDATLTAARRAGAVPLPASAHPARLSVTVDGLLRRRS
jgi:hypothetical protein